MIKWHNDYLLVIAALLILFWLGMIFGVIPVGTPHITPTVIP